MQEPVSFKNFIEAMPQQFQRALSGSPVTVEIPLKAGSRSLIFELVARPQDSGIQARPFKSEKIESAKICFTRALRNFSSVPIKNEDGEIVVYARRLPIPDPS